MGRLKRHPRGASLAVALILLLAPALTVAPASAAIVPTGASARAARGYWTPARMRGALPLAGSHRRGPAPSASASAAAELIADPTAPGLSQYGAVFIVTDTGLRGRCSGTAVQAGNRSLVVTAGHCVHDFGHWLSGRWVFVPGYSYGQRPLGTFAAKWLGTTPQWLHRENDNFDVGMAVVSRNERGQRLADVVTPDKIAWGLSRRQIFDIYGYPVAEPFNGASLQRCPQTPYEGHDFLSFLTTGPLDLAVECDVTPGASGGGWVIDGDTLNGVTSSGYSDNPDTTYGPYFGAAIGRLYREAARVRR
jgi:V8-like Glu-specific endopeptidase